MDFCTFFYLQKNRQSLNGGFKQNKEIRFFVQACLSSFLYFALIFCFHVLAPLAKNKWQGFLASSVSWELTHTFNGMIMVGFSMKFKIKQERKLVKISEMSRIPTTFS
uniref:7TM GPCR serpentine receptor class x (Srx) domain-containing protein n=1 Tax=Panagrolaimus sp. JU765 TaxID=591449 RepID=A0AC34R1Q2_9BILA